MIRQFDVIDNPSVRSRSIAPYLVVVRSQLIIATHSPILLGYPDAWIYQVSEHGLERVEYEDTDHYQVTRNFLNRREMMLDVLLKPE